MPCVLSKLLDNLTLNENASAETGLPSIESILSDLQEKGYCVIENVLTTEEVEQAKTYFYSWLNSNSQIKKIHNKVSPHGIIKHFQVGQQLHAWFIRTRKAVQNIFKGIWKTDELVVSYDGTCWISSDTKKKDNLWTHTDQAPNKKGLTCYQGFVALTDNTERTLVVYEGSHLLHEAYAKEKNLNSSKDWQLIDKDYLDKIADKKRVLPVKAGSLVLWDSRTFHQNQYGTKPEERVVQYVSFLPRSGLTPKMQEKRKKYFEDLRTTSHWAYPVRVNGQQPQNYGNKELIIDYASLVRPELDDLMEDILQLV
jgi:ectoine hydroxylase-related dioxygenase (phytanoyl-CoA dioxygenase family)